MRKPKRASFRRLALVAAVAFAFAVSSVGTISYAAEDASKYPVRFDLREQGVVTPVKQQNPFGTCWAFGGTAAAETSILSSLGETYESFPLDLSEKHLAWFALHPIREIEDPLQAGEGMYVRDEENVYDTGGLQILVTSLYASGCGPVGEQYFPYRGAAGLTEYEWMLANKEEWKTENREAGYAKFQRELAAMSAVKRDRMLAESGKTEDEFFETWFDALYEERLEKEKLQLQYSAKDNWKIRDPKEGGSSRLFTGGFILKNGNILPEYGIYDEEAHWQGINEESVSAIKQELLNGRAVSIAFCADTSRPGQVVTGQYINLDTYAHYTHNDFSQGGLPNHAVTIVGWDDNYSRDHFNKGHRPAKNGAWIVKNSWGSETDAKPGEIGYMDWGTVNEEGLHTGYFYLSYYDKSICDAETMEFSQNLAGNETGFSVYAYDYMPAVSSLDVSSKEIMKTANVFTMEGKETLQSVSARTAAANSRVVFEIYALDSNTEGLKEKTRLAAFSTNFEYAGFHRVDLDKPVTLEDGQRFCIVVTEYVIAEDGSRTYMISANAAPDKDADPDDLSYAAAVVNPGESYLFDEGQWVDWTSVLNELGEENKLEIDNFSIKAYMVPAE